MNIDVIDSNRVDNGHLAEQRRLHPNAILAENVGAMVEGIIGRAGTTGTIEILRIFGHAAAGEQGMGNSEFTSKDEQLIQIDGNGHLTNRSQLVRLQRYFSPTSRVELHGCQVARHHRGRELLRQLAHLWNCAARGGAIDQHADAADAIEGPIIEARSVRGHLTPRVHQVR